MFVSKFVFLFFVFIFVACGNSVSQTGNTNQTQQKDKTELYLRLERLGCYGTCPSYILSVEPNGKVLFEGKSFTEVKGNIENKISNEQLERLITEIENSKFYSFDDSYTQDSKNCPSIATDMATVIISIKLNGKEKTIKHYWGCWINQIPKEINTSNIKVEKVYAPQVFPRQLYDLENKIDEIVETKRWVGEGK